MYAPGQLAPEAKNTQEQWPRSMDLFVNASSRLSKYKYLWGGREFGTCVHAAASRLPNSLVW